MSFQIKKNLKKVNILGTGDGWQLAPRESDAMIYCLNDYIFIERYKVKPDVLIIMDILDEKPQIVSGINNLGDIIQRINSLKVPLIAPYRYEEIPLSEPFPLDECVKRFGQPYFTNTICYMIAYALLQGAEEIQIFGVNQASSAEYYGEKSGVEYWLGIVNGMGVKLTINGEKSELLTLKKRLGGGILYGYNAPYQVIVDNRERLGEEVIKKLMQPPKKFSTIVRKIL